LNYVAGLPADGHPSRY